MAPQVWRRRTLERCLTEVGKATGRPECFLTMQLVKQLMMKISVFSQRVKNRNVKRMVQR
uniref:M-phase phosphoprotein 10 n=1 Tax=Homo sapiens TaxID=9606 RepID=A0A8Q3WKB6_HUMAN